MSKEKFASLDLYSLSYPSLDHAHCFLRPTDHFHPVSMPVATAQPSSGSFADDKGQEKSRLRKFSDGFEAATTAGFMDGGTIGGLHYLYERYLDPEAKARSRFQSPTKSFPWSGFTKYCNKSGHTAIHASTLMLALNLCGFNYNRFVPWRRNRDERTQAVVDDAAVALGLPLAIWPSLRAFKAQEDRNLYSTWGRIRGLYHGPGKDPKYRQHAAACLFVPAAIKFGDIALVAGVAFLHGSPGL